MYFSRIKVVKMLAVCTLPPKKYTDFQDCEPKVTLNIKSFPLPFSFLYMYETKPSINIITAVVAALWTSKHLLSLQNDASFLAALSGKSY